MLRHRELRALGLRCLEVAKPACDCCRFFGGAAQSEVRRLRRSLPSLAEVLQGGGASSSLPRVLLSRPRSPLRSGCGWEISRASNSLFFDGCMLRSEHCLSSATWISMRGTRSSSRVPDLQLSLGSCACASSRSFPQSPGASSPSTSPHSGGSSSICGEAVGTAPDFVELAEPRWRLAEISIDG